MTLVLDGAPSDLLAFALERTARCNGISGAALTVVQCVSNEEQVAAAVDAGATTLCVAGTPIRRLGPLPVVRTTGEDIEAMSLGELAELMEEVGGPALDGMSLAEARESAWQFIEENFGAEEHDHDHDEEEDDSIAYVGGGKYTENVPPNSTTWASRSSSR